ncbi:hypothetical protein HN011_009491 [Eciton burchellii]|nr:hypothetical protein HN011_009491 [Eciton burchellii]
MTLLVQLKASTMLYNRLPGVPNNPDINIKYSSAMKEELAEFSEAMANCPVLKNRCPVLKNKLNRVIKALKNLLDLERNHENI